ncbi:MAG: DUF5060 domain-containing protein [Planctomycetota bacterium]
MTRKRLEGLAPAIVALISALAVTTALGQTQWQTVERTFTGPGGLSESSATNPFLDYRLNVTFTHNGEDVVVPGFFDGVDTGGNSIWKVRFTPDKAGEWSYTASFRTDSNVAVDLNPNAGSATGFDGASDAFTVAPRDPNAPGFLSKGRLAYTGDHYLKTRGDNKHWLKTGADSPENFLGYLGFDNTQSLNGRGPDYTGTPGLGGNTYGRLHQYPVHRAHWNPGDPDWTRSDGPNAGVEDGRNIIGAVNYLADQGVNSVYFLPMNIGGDGQDSWPYVNPGDQTRFDTSKLNQWEQVFTHMQEKGINLHMVLNEAEAANKNTLDNATLGNERKLFYREMIARFGHHNGIYLNMSEEYNRGLELSPEDVREWAEYIAEVDPYDIPVTVHNGNFGNWPDGTAFPGQHDDVSSIGQRNEQEPFLGPDFTDTVDGTTVYSNDFHDLISFQSYNEGRAGDDAEYFANRSAALGKPVPFMHDEPESLDSLSADNVRKSMTWDHFLSKGAGIEWFVRQQDQSLEDFTQFEEVWQQTAIARRFFEDHLPFWEMSPDDELLRGEDTDFGGGEVFAKLGEVYAFYLPDGSNDDGIGGIPPELNLSGFGDLPFLLRWFNPRTGLFEGDAIDLTGGGWVSIGYTPDGFQNTSDWVGLVTLVPEPGVVALLVPAGLLIARRRR